LLISPKDKWSIRQQCRLLSISRASFYYVPQQENVELQQFTGGFF
jgi:hypothetical protein